MRLFLLVVLAGVTRFVRAGATGVALREPADVDSLGERTSDGNLLPTAPDDKRAGRDLGHTLNAGAFAHAEPQRLDAGVRIVNRDDLDLVSPAHAVESVRFTNGSGVGVRIVGRLLVSVAHRALLPGSWNHGAVIRIY
jgi:hypothetical protein